MTPLKRVLTLAAATLTSALLLASPSATATPTAPASVAPVTAAPASAVLATAIPPICYESLPAEAHDTLDLIDQGGPYPYPQDGTVFQNREGILPDEQTGYYHEYTVETPGSPDRGARRIVTGEDENQDYYTSDHYQSFGAVDYSC